jgi:transposase
LDECHFQQHGSRYRLWVPPEEKNPVLYHAPTRKSIAYFGALRLADGTFVARRSPHFNGQTFEQFLRQLFRHRRRGRRMVLVMDNSTYHHVRTLLPLKRKYRQSVTWVYLPAYSPELNPIERVWKLVRRLCVHNRYFGALDELIEVVDRQFAHWARANHTLRRLCAIT